MSKLTCKVIGKRCNEFGRRCALVRGHAEPECTSEPKPGTSVGPISIFVVSLLLAMLVGGCVTEEAADTLELADLVFVEPSGCGYAPEPPFPVTTIVAIDDIEHAVMLPDEWQAVVNYRNRVITWGSCMRNFELRLVLFGIER